MPNYARQSALDLDEMYGHYIKNDNNVAMMRNIRTKEKMKSAHHCEDKECGGRPSMRCVSLLHFSWCLAPVVDKDRSSDTYGEVVICGQRFQCISPKGCAKHPYLEGFNIDIRDARNGYPSTEVKWKLIFEAFKTEHDAALADNAEQQELSREWEGMTDHQKRRQRKLQDQATFHRCREQECAAGRQEIEEVPLRDEEVSLTGDGEIVGVAAGVYGLCSAYRAPYTRPSVKLTCAVKDDHGPSKPASDVLPSAEATPITPSVATLLPSKNPESLSASTDNGEVADQQVPVEMPATQLLWKHTQRQGVRVASRANEEDDMMSGASPRGWNSVRGGETGISGKAVRAANL